MSSVFDIADCRRFGICAASTGTKEAMPILRQRASPGRSIRGF